MEEVVLDHLLTLVKVLTNIVTFIINRKHGEQVHAIHLAWLYEGKLMNVSVSTGKSRMCFTFLEQLVKQDQAMLAVCL